MDNYKIITDLDIHRSKVLYILLNVHVCVCVCACKNYMNLMFHNKGMDMINFPRILNSKKVMAAVPNYLRGPPPIVSYTYTRTIAGKIFNNRKVVNELNMDCGTAGMVCSCNSSRYKYESCGHVVTGDLSIIKDVKLRNLISKGPAHREQNSIDWRLNLKNCKAAVSRHAKKWAKEANVDRHVLRDWKETVYKFIDEKVASLKQRKINKRKKHVLKSRVNLYYVLTTELLHGTVQEQFQELF